jgi:hypothetical protein
MILIVFCLAFGTLTAQETVIRNAIDLFFEGFHEKDTLKLQSVCDKNIVLHSVSVGKSGNVLRIETASELMKSITDIPAKVKFEERILTYKIESDGAIATVWTPYEFYINGRISHSGVNSFQLYNDNGNWRILYILDTRKK